MATNNKRHKLPRNLLKLISNDDRIIRWFETLQSQTNDDIPARMDEQLVEYASLLQQLKTVVNIRIDGIQTFTDSLVSHITTNKKDINSLKQSDIALNMKLAALQTEIASMKTQVADINNRLTLAEGKLKNAVN